MAINNIDPEYLGQVVQIITDSQPHLAATGAEEMELDIDALDTPTLRKLEKFVKACNSKRRRRRSNTSPEPLSLEDKQLKVVEAAFSTSSTIRELERELATLEGRPLPPPIDLPPPLKKKKEKPKKKASSDLLKSESDSESELDLMSLSDESKPLHVPPSEKVVLKNADQWNIEEQDTAVAAYDAPLGESQALWEKLKTRENMNKALEKERREKEERQRREAERERRERELLELQAARERREREEKANEQVQREKMEQERLREEERLRAQLELEQAAPTVNLGNENEIIENFEKTLGDASDKLPFN